MLLLSWRHTRCCGCGCGAGAASGGSGSCGCRLDGGDLDSGGEERPSWGERLARGELQRPSRIGERLGLADDDPDADLLAFFAACSCGRCLCCCCCCCCEARTRGHGEHAAATAADDAVPRRSPRLVHGATEGALYADRRLDGASLAFPRSLQQARQQQLRPGPSRLVGAHGSCSPRVPRHGQGRGRQLLLLGPLLGPGLVVLAPFHVGRPNPRQCLLDGHGASALCHRVLVRRLGRWQGR
mmetsp:Transcript_824/g.3342  ORF Transcript_824/g.3342 Transcript_824/m.3342 type:complete len:241 (-) Transcript_824:2218-2940(-)